jgi:hypothetical protein
MKKPNFVLVNGAKEANWLLKKLYPRDKELYLRLGSFVPEGFEAYISIRHSADARNPVQVEDLNYEKLNLILADHTVDPSRCFYGLWDGYGWDFEGNYKNIFDGKSIIFDTSRERFEFSDKLFIEGYKYYLLFGDLFDSLKIGYNVGNTFCAQKPNLVWPEKREWFMATYFEFQVTFITGSKKLIDFIESSFPTMTERFVPTDRLTKIFVAEF